MQLLPNTIKILSNFATINPGMAIRVGNIQSTVSLVTSFVAQATLAEDFPQEFYIYDVDKFLKFYKAIKDAELEFKENYLVIHNNEESLMYYYADSDMIVTPKKEPYVHDQIDLSFFVSPELMVKMRSLSSISNNFKHIKIDIESEDKVKLSLCDKSSFSNDKRTENSYTVFVPGSSPNKDFATTHRSLFLNMDIFRMLLEGSYEFFLTILKNNGTNENIYLLRMANTTYNVSYWTSVSSSND